MKIPCIHFYLACSHFPFSLLAHVFPASPPPLTLPPSPPLTVVVMRLPSDLSGKPRPACPCERRTPALRAKERKKSDPGNKMKQRRMDAEQHHVSSLWRAVLTADFMTACDHKENMDRWQMWDITKGKPCVTVPRETRVPKPLQDEESDDEETRMLCRTYSDAPKGFTVWGACRGSLCYA